MHEDWMRLHIRCMSWTFGQSQTVSRLHSTRNQQHSETLLNMFDRGSSKHPHTLTLKRVNAAIINFQLV